MSQGKGGHQGPRLAWLGNRSWEARCLSPWLPIAAAVALERDFLPALGSPVSKAVPGELLQAFEGTASLEATIGRRLFWGSDSLSHPDLMRAAETIRSILDSCSALVSYIPFTHPQAWLPKPLWLVPGDILSIFACKRRTRSWLAANGLPIPKPFDSASGLWPELKGKAVLQALTGSCGSRTFIGEAVELLRLIEEEKISPAMISPCLPGIVLNGHVVIFGPDSIEVPWPSVQLLTLVPYGKCLRPLYAGNDFAAYARLPEEIRAAFEQNLHRVGEAAASSGYRGILGVDALCDQENGDVHLLEVNPRMQGSTGLLTLIEAAAGVVPVTARYFLGLLGEHSGVAVPRPPLPAGPSVPSAMIHLREGTQYRMDIDPTSILYYADEATGPCDPLAVRRRVVMLGGVALRG